jgi:hypothetical protein
MASCRRKALGQWSLHCVLMDCDNFLVWNVRDHNSRARHMMVVDLVFTERVSVVCMSSGDQNFCI